MTPDKLDTMNLWLAILAIVSVAQFLMFIAAAIVGFRLYRRTAAMIDRLEVHHVAPLAARVHLLLDEVQDLTRRVQRADEAVRSAIGRTEDTVLRLMKLASRAWPVVGTWRAVAAAAGAFARQRSTPRRRVIESRRAGITASP